MNFIDLRHYFRYALILPALLTLWSVELVAQDEVPADTSSAVVSGEHTDSSAVVAVTTQIDTVTIRTDSITDVVNDNSVLDIAVNRGIYIQSDDGMLELRILGSIRAMFNYSNQDLANKQAINPYQVPTGDGGKVRNYFAGLQQTRIGFEVTRKTNAVGDVFMRIETDFNNGRNALRIRHAYGAVGRFLVGQTWSLLNNAGYQPLAVSHHGPAGAINIRTPQIRYTRRYQNQMSWSVALEYSPPDIGVADTHSVSALQVTPNLTGRYTYSSDQLTFRIAALSTLIGGQGANEEFEYRFAWGASLAMSVRTGKGQVFGSFTAGRSISNYLNVFRGGGEDIAYDPFAQKYQAVYSTAGYLAFEHPLPAHLRVSVAFGLASLFDEDFRPDETYHYGYNLLVNTFWDPVPGLTIGMEYGLGARRDLGGDNGFASRLSVLAYYDF